METKDSQLQLSRWDHVRVTPVEKDIDSEHYQSSLLIFFTYTNNETKKCQFIHQPPIRDASTLFKLSIDNLKVLRKFVEDT